LPTSLPISPHDLSRYVVHLTKRHKVPAIKTKLSAIAWKHRMEFKEDPTRNFRIQKILVGKQKSTTMTQEKLKPLSYEILTSILPHIKAATHNGYEKSLFKAVFTLAYYACLRVGEYAISADDQHTLTVENVSFVNTKNSCKIKMILPTFKHSKGQEILYIESETNTSTCPVKILKDYLTVRPKVLGPLFIHKDTKPVTRNAVSEVLRATIGKTKLNPKDFSPHSLRIGRATDLAIQNTPEHVIKKTGRWNSTAYINYIRLNNFHVPHAPKY